MPSNNKDDLTSVGQIIFAILLPFALVFVVLVKIGKVFYDFLLTRKQKNAKIKENGAQRL